MGCLPLRFIRDDLLPSRTFGPPRLAKVEEENEKSALQLRSASAWSSRRRWIRKAIGILLEEMKKMKRNEEGI